MFQTIGMAAAISIIFTGMALADPIEGDWKTEKGATAGIASCGGGFCIEMKSGAYTGKKIGSFKADGGSAYSGKITDPATDKTYTGKATLSGSTLKMSGCVLGGLFCRSQNWKKL